jgi:hypothetical protein
MVFSQENSKMNSPTYPYKSTWDWNFELKEYLSQFNAVVLQWRFSLPFQPYWLKQRSTLTENDIKNTLTGLLLGVLNYIFCSTCCFCCLYESLQAFLALWSSFFLGWGGGGVRPAKSYTSWFIRVPIQRFFFYLNLRHPICLFIYDFPTIILSSYASLIFPLLFNPPSFIIYLMMMYNIRWRVNSRKLIILQLFSLINPSVTEAGIPVSLR